MELLVFVTSLVKNFEFSPPPGGKISLDHVPMFGFGRILDPDQKLLITSRTD